jgi:hypothetical protein
LMKPARFQMRDASGSDNPDTAGRRQNDLVDVGARKALLDAKAENMIAVKAKQAVGRSDPDEAFLVLQDAGRRQEAQAEIFTHLLKDVVRPTRKGKRGRLGGLCLCGKGTERQSCHDNQEKGGGSLAPHEHSG